MRLILDGTVVRVRLDRKATSISLLVVIGVREDGQKVLLALENMGGETTEAWRAVLDDLVARGLRRPAFVIVDGASGLEKAIAAVWDGVPVQRCTVHKHRNLLAHAPFAPARRQRLAKRPAWPTTSRLSRGFQLLPRRICERQRRSVSSPPGGRAAAEAG